LEIGKTMDSRGTAVSTQETGAPHVVESYGEPGSSFASARTQGIETIPGGSGNLATLPAALDAAAAPVRQPANPAKAILDSWIAADPLSLNLLHEIRGIALSASTVLMRGETGAGKDLLASILHYLGPHPEAPLLRIDCAALPRQLLDSELFGYEDNVFPGAPAKVGQLELAGAGTIVLDEVAALTMPVQAKLLRVIDEKRCERLGGTRSIAISARILALTAVDLEHALARRTFREDLYYRLNVVPIVVPALRDRPADIRPLAEFFLARLAELHRKPRLAFAPAVLAALETFSYPGNVRELRTLVERAVISATPPEILPQDLPPHVRDAAPQIAERSLEQMERTHIAAVLQLTQGKKTQAARILGISRKTLLEKRKRYGLE
jgi:transcriptional regulator with PAS, ATPase and Fis domain